MHNDDSAAAEKGKLVALQQQLSMQNEQLENVELEARQTRAQLHAAQRDLGETAFHSQQLESMAQVIQHSTFRNINIQNASNIVYLIKGEILQVHARALQDANTLNNELKVQVQHLQSQLKQIKSQLNLRQQQVIHEHACADKASHTAHELKIVLHWQTSILEDLIFSWRASVETLQDQLEELCDDVPRRPLRLLQELCADMHKRFNNSSIRWTHDQDFRQRALGATATVEYMEIHKCMHNEEGGGGGQGIHPTSWQLSHDFTGSTADPQCASARLRAMERKDSKGDADESEDIEGSTASCKSSVDARNAENTSPLISGTVISDIRNSPIV